MTSKPPKKLVLSGSGILYPYHVGAVRRIAEDYTIESITGVSGGAIVGASVASGYEPGEELENLVLNTLPAEKNLLDWNWFPFSSKGLIKGGMIEEEFDRWYVPTFEETDVPLKIGTVNLNTQSYRFFGSKETPHFSVSRAVRASMTFPLAFEPVKIDQDLYVDGGVMSYFPLDVHENGEDVIGVRISGASDPDLREINGVWEYVMALMKSMMNATIQEDTEDATFADVIHVQGERGPLELGITSEVASTLIEKGYDVADRQLE